MALMTFDGGIPWDEFEAHFVAVSMCNDWNATEKGYYLANTLRGSALNVLNSIPVESRYDFDILMSNLEEGFGLRHLAPYFAHQLLCVAQDDGETLQQLSIRVETLVIRAYPDCSVISLQSLMVQSFTNAITNINTRKDVAMGVCKTLNEALIRAIRSEAFDNFLNPNKCKKRSQLPGLSAVTQVTTNGYDNLASTVNGNFELRCKERTIGKNNLFSERTNSVNTTDTLNEMLKRWVDENSDAYLSSLSQKNTNKAIISTSDNEIESTSSKTDQESYFAEFMNGDSQFKPLIIDELASIKCVKNVNDSCNPVENNSKGYCNDIVFDDKVSKKADQKCVENRDNEINSDPSFIYHLTKCCTTVDENVCLPIIDIENKKCTTVSTKCETLENYKNVIADVKPEDVEKDVLPINLKEVKPVHSKNKNCFTIVHILLPTHHVYVFDNEVADAECSFDLITQRDTFMDCRENIKAINDDFDFRKDENTFHFCKTGISGMIEDYLDRTDENSFKTVSLVRKRTLSNVQIEIQAWIYLMWNIVMAMLSHMSVNFACWKVRHKWPPPELCVCCLSVYLDYELDYPCITLIMYTCFQCHHEDVDTSCLKVRGELLIEGGIVLRAAIMIFITIGYNNMII